MCSLFNNVGGQCDLFNVDLPTFKIFVFDYLEAITELIFISCISEREGSDVSAPECANCLTNMFLIFYLARNWV